MNNETNRLITQVQIDNDKAQGFRPGHVHRVLWAIILIGGIVLFLRLGGVLPGGFTLAFASIMGGALVADVLAWNAGKKLLGILIIIGMAVALVLGIAFMAFN